MSSHSKIIAKHGATYSCNIQLLVVLKQRKHLSLTHSVLFDNVRGLTRVKAPERPSLEIGDQHLSAATNP